MPRKILQENPRENPPKFIQQKFSNTFLQIGQGKNWPRGIPRLMKMGWSSLEGVLWRAGCALFFPLPSQPLRLHGLGLPLPTRPEAQDSFLRERMCLRPCQFSQWARGGVRGGARGCEKGFAFQEGFLLFSDGFRRKEEFEETLANLLITHFSF